MEDYFTPEIINTILTVLVIPLLGLMAKAMVSYTRREIAHLEEKIGAEAVNTLLNRAGDAIESAVIAVNQTFVEELKQQGSFDAAAMEKAFKLAKEKAMTLLGETAKTELSLVLGDLEAWIETKIEVYVNRNKQL
ncbi:hypothetical protein [Paenibacillus riograndensis]|uniref:Putative membrane protein n=1 Tax=Paenibacillus riograndensis SBR5 TaxID=1073571 RepID=A0A0E4HBH5_9BACL|nr:hypothetical protein [Paenibacillus riograndensis]CQR56694.1 putative membrane protein [Paenibacillus riograndensis SBR5]